MSVHLYHPDLTKFHYRINVQAYFYQEFRDYVTPVNHMHKRIEVLYVVNGGGIMALDNDEIVMKAGDFILVNSDVFHRLRVTAEKPCRVLNIEFMMIPCDDAFYSIRNLVENVPTLKKLLQSKKPYLILKDTHKELADSIRALIRQLNQQEGSEDFTHQVLLTHILITISKLYHISTVIDNDEQNPYVVKAIEYMESHYDYDLKVSRIAKEVNIHERYLQQLFHDHLGTTVNDYLTRLRIEKAKQLLLYTELSIVDISQYVGMNSQQYFSYLFKKLTNETPREYRKKMIRLKAEDNFFD